MKPDMDDIALAIREKATRLRELEAETVKLRKELEEIRRAAVMATSQPVKRGPELRGKHHRPIDPASCAGVAQRVLIEAGAPLRVDMLLELMKKRGHPVKKATLIGQLARYVRKTEVFTRPEASTYGLLDYTPPLEPPIGWEGEGGNSEK